MAEDLETIFADAKAKAESASNIAYNWANGTDTDTVATLNGTLPSIAKFMADNDIATSTATAVQAAIDAQTAYDNFDDRYLGEFSVAPTLDNDGNTLLVGALYYDTILEGMYVWSGSVWKTVGSVIDTISADFVFTSTASQTVFTGADDNALVLTFDSNAGILVFLDGIKLIETTDYTVGVDTITLTVGATVGQKLVVTAFNYLDNTALNASSIPNVPNGNIASTNLQAAIDELDSEKASLGLANVFTSDQTISSTTPQLNLEETDAGVDAKRWKFIAEGEVFKLQARNDADGVLANLLTLDRSGNISLNGTLPATSVSYAGSTNLTSTNVEDALDELDLEKEPADPTILKDADIGVSVQAYDAALFNIPARNGALNQYPVTQGESTRTGMSSTIYTGAGTTQSVNTGVDMATGDLGGLVWIKSRNNTWQHIITDTIRGGGAYLQTNTTSAESAGLSNTFDTTGFSVGASGATNANTDTYVAWSFQTNQKTTGLTNRNKAYTCHYNTDLGFSIVGYVGDGVAGHEIPHHLGVEPEFSIYKNRDGVTNWIVSGSQIGSNVDGDYLQLNTTSSLLNAASLSILPSELTTQLGFSGEINASAQNHISYHFASKAGISKVGKYIGTGAAGNYIDCGLKVGFLMVKNLTNADSWLIIDTVRGGTKNLYADLSIAEVTVGAVESVDDGFVLLTNAGYSNALNDEYIFVAFAETSTDATKSWTDYTYPTTADTLSIQQNTLISFANGFSASGQVDTQEQVGAGVTYTLGAGFENQHLWLYKDKAGSYGVTEYRPLEGITRNDADTWGEVSPLDASLRTTAKHFDYESSTGVALASGEVSTEEAYNAFNKSTLSTSKWSVLSITTSTIQYKATEKRILKSWRIRASDDADTVPRQFTVEGSNDGFNWTAIDSTYTASDFTDPTIGLWSDIQDTSANTTAYRYHRLNITLNHGDGAATEICELEFNTILPSDYYLVNEGVMYNSSDVAIERTYLAELMTNDDGEVSWYRNLPIAKQRFNEVEIHNDLKVRGEISNAGVATAWVNFDGTQNPPLIRDSFNVKDVVDLGTGYYKIIFEEPMDDLSFNAVASVEHDGTAITYSVGVLTEAKDSTSVLAYRSTTRTDNSQISVTIFGGKD